MVRTKNINIIIILIIIIAGISTLLVIQRSVGERLLDESNTQTPITKFIVTNKSITLLENERPVSYRVAIENLESETIDYNVKILFNKNVIYDKNITLKSGEIWDRTMSIRPNFGKHDKRKYAKLEFLLYKDNKLYKRSVSQILFSRSKKLSNTSSAEAKTNENIENNEIAINSTRRIGNNIIYNFKTGEILKLTLSQHKPYDESHDRSHDKSYDDAYYQVDAFNATYMTTATNDRIVFLGDMYERALITRVDYLFPIIYEIQNKVLKVGDGIKLKNGYAITVASIENDPYNKKIKIVSLEITKNRRVVRRIIHRHHSTVDYWKEIDDYKKQKILRIKLGRITIDKTGKSVVLSVTQYDKAVTIRRGSAYGEFVITNVTDDTIIMKNDEVIKMPKRKMFSLMNGKIKIKV